MAVTRHNPAITNALLGTGVKLTAPRRTTKQRPKARFAPKMILQFRRYLAEAIAPLHEEQYSGKPDASPAVESRRTQQLGEHGGTGGGRL